MTSVLVIDDDKHVLRTFSRILTSYGFNVDTAETGREAIEKAGEKCYDVALVDFRLPDIDGTHLLSKLKDSNNKIVKIMITGFPSVDFGANALDEGADAYLVKPVNPKDLILLIQEKIKRNA